MVEKIKKDADRLLLVMIIINFRYILLKLDFFSILKLKLVYLRLFLSFLTFPKFWKQNVMYCGHKDIETENQ